MLAHIPCRLVQKRYQIFCIENERKSTKFTAFFPFILTKKSSVSLDTTKLVPFFKRDKTFESTTEVMFWFEVPLNDKPFEE